MPELPEVQTIVSELDRKLKNREILRVKISTPKMVHIGPAVVSNIRKDNPRAASRFAGFLRGRKILSVNRRAKMLIFKFTGSFVMLAHLKMTGQFIFEDEKLRQKTGGKYRLFNNLKLPPVRLPGKHTHAVFAFSDGSRLYFNDIRKFGYLKLLRDNEIQRVKEFREYGPEPLDKKFTSPRFMESVIKRGSGKIKEVLMDPRVVAGIGNIYGDEILFHAGVRPSRKVSSLSTGELKNIYRWIKPVLKKGILAKGSSVGDFVRTDGSFGRMGKYHFVYRRAGQKCKRCQSAVKSVKIGGRTASYCPKCQK